MKLGIVILNYQDYRMTISLVNASRTISDLDYIVVVDNASPNESFNKLSQNNDGTWILLKASENRGYSAGNNIGIKYLIEHTDAEIIGIVNPDVEFCDLSIFTKIKYDFTRHPECAAITGIQQIPEWGDKEFPLFCVPKKRWYLILNNLTICRVLFRVLNITARGYIERYLKDKKDFCYIYGTPGCCFFIRKEDFKMAGYFDESVFMYFEEDILAEKIKKLHRYQGLDRTVKFIHNQSVTTKTVCSILNRQKIFKRSEQYFYMKYVSKNIIDKVFYKLTLFIYWLERPLLNRIHR